MKPVFLIALIFISATATHAQAYQVKQIITHPPGEKPDTITLFGLDSAKNGQILDEIPQFRGDLNAFVRKNVHYPADAKHRHVSGSVVIAFKIDKEGKLSGIRVDNSLYPSLDAEAIRLVKLMPPWKPAILNGQAVDASWFVYIPFRQ